MNFSTENSVLFESKYVFFFGIWLLVVFWQLFVIIKLYRRHKTNMEAVHVYQLNLLIDLLLAVLTVAFWNVYQKHLMKLFDNGFCNIISFLYHFIHLSMFCSTSILHYDRYKYLCLKSTYKQKETFQHAIDKILSFKILILIVTLFGFVLDFRDAKKQK